MRKIAFGRLRILPRDFYDLSIEDAALMFQGWQDDLIQQQDTARTVAMLIADVTNKSMGGKGVMKNMFSIWPLPGDPGGKGGDGIDPALMEKLNRRLAEQQKLKGGRN